MVNWIYIFKSGRRMGIFFLIHMLAFAGGAFAMQDSVPAPKIKIGLLMNGDACNIDWSAVLSRYEIINANNKSYLMSQFGYNLDKRLFNHKPEYCLIYAGLTDVLLQQPLTKIADAYRSMCERMLKNSVTPIIILTLPVDGQSAVNAQIDLLNNNLRNYAAENDGVLILDAAQGMTHENQLASKYTSDGFILNRDGRELFAENTAQFLSDVLMWRNGLGAPATTTKDLASMAIDKINKDTPGNIRIAMLGNSITAGGGDWNKWLNRTDVLNAGMSGYTTGQMLWHIDSTVLNTSCQICFISGGINDLFNNIPQSVTLINLSNILSKLKSHNIIPVVQLVLYNYNKEALNRRVDHLNEGIKKICIKNDVEYIDLNPDMADENGLKQKYTTDGTHLTREGYAIWSEVLKTFLVKKAF